MARRMNSNFPAGALKKKKEKTTGAKEIFLHYDEYRIANNR